MCPNRQLLSVYYDEELPPPWKEKMEAHLAGCPECRNILVRYRSFALDRDREEAVRNAPMEAAKTRVWQNLAPLAEKEAPRMPRNTLWRRSVSLPLPLAAAMAALVVAAFTLVLRNRPAPMTVPQEIISANGMGLDLQGIAPVSDIRGVFQYLSNEDDVVILRLPESKSFVSYGEPLYIKGEDYSRSTPHR
ncbi:MAG: zf-HC2 domain-containing protein [Spirochaetaceae bacterium]|nr:zf-HC2 domain-containing protein [Spirochaetaceae bacterium]